MKHIYLGDGGFLVLIYDVDGGRAEHDCHETVAWVVVLVFAATTRKLSVTVYIYRYCLDRLIYSS